MTTLQQLLHALLHIDTTLLSFVATYGSWTYAALFAIIFCETGLVITPFLPGDSLLFAAGSIAAHDSSQLNIQVLFTLLLLASIFGNKVNYLIGRLLGPRVFTAKDFPLFNRKHLMNAHRFYQQHGGKTIIVARFIPILRTFAPFVAGIGTMDLRLFSLYNLISALLWIGSLLFAGYFLGSLPFAQNHFSVIIYGIVLVSVGLPFLLSFISKMRYRVDI